MSTLKITGMCFSPSRLVQETVLGKSKYTRTGQLFHLHTDAIHSLALHEMRLIACKMLWNFDFELCEESRGTWFEQKCFWALWSKPPLWVKATARRPQEMNVK
jgi:hypothetical protein